jgi:esterase/lipase superfamily enzyme
VPLSESEFFNAVKASSKQELVFVHGFNTAFIPSLLRIGPVARDMKIRPLGIHQDK